MNLRKIKMLILVIILFFGITTNRGFAIKKKARFLSPKSFYIYVEGGYFCINPADPFMYNNYDWEDTFFYGAGFTLLNLYNRYKISIEFDFTDIDYDIYSNEGFFNQDISVYNLKLNFEYFFKNEKFSIFSGIGRSNITYHANDKITYKIKMDSIIFEFGIKYLFSNHIALRGELKLFSYTDDYTFCINKDYPMASAFSLGFEFKL